MSELHDNTGFHNYYLSLIVNFSGVYTAKVAYIATREVSVMFKNSNGEEIVNTESEELLAMIDMTIVKEEEDLQLLEPFREQFLSLKKREEEAKEASRLAELARTRVVPGFKGSSLYDWTDRTTSSGAGTGARPAIQGTGKGTIGNDGKYREGNKTYVPVHESNIASKVRGQILDWLILGTDTFTNMNPTKQFDTINEAIAFFQNFFSDKTPDSYTYFLDRMGRYMPGLFEEWLPETVSTIGMCDFDSVAVVESDLHDLFDLYPVYLKLLRDPDADNLTKAERKKLKRIKESQGA